MRLSRLVRQATQRIGRYERECTLRQAGTQTPLLPTWCGTGPVWSGLPATYQAAPAPTQTGSWPPDAWANPYAAPAPAAVSPPNRRTATVAALAVVIGLLGIVISAEVSHALTLRDDNASAADGTSGVPLTVPSPQVSTGRHLPFGVAGLTLNPQSQNMAHHLTTDAETELTRGGGTITIGYYDTPAGSSKLFLEIVDGKPESGTQDAPVRRLSELESGFNGAVGSRSSSGSASTWSLVPSGPGTPMFCRTATDYTTPIRACAFTKGTSAVIIGIYQPTAADDQLIEEVRTAITGSNQTSAKQLSRRRGLNPRPIAYEAIALPLSYSGGRRSPICR